MKEMVDADDRVHAVKKHSRIDFELPVWRKRLHWDPIDREDRIRDLSKKMWSNNGEPDSRDEEFWLAAEHQIDREILDAAQKEIDRDEDFGLKPWSS